MVGEKIVREVAELSGKRSLAGTAVVEGNEDIGSVGHLMRLGVSISTDQVGQLNDILDEG